jgi:hypothetical protein
LGEWTLETSLASPTPAAELVFNYSAHGNKISLIESLIGKAGWLRLDRLEVTAFETTDELLFSGLTDDGRALDQEACKKLMAVEAQGQPERLADQPPAELNANSDRHIAAAISNILEINQRLFNDERDKLEKWAEDKLMASEEALRNTKARITQLKRDARKAATLQEQSGIQQEISALEKQQRRQRQEIFAVEDEIIDKRDQLIESLQQRLQEKTETNTLFTLRWHVV